METIYDVDFFIAKFQAIPESRWNDFSQYDPTTETRCAFGHCGWKIPNGCIVNGDETIEGKSLWNLFESAGFGLNSKKWITDVNNGFSPNYKQSTPKQRILAALHDIKKLQQQQPEKSETIVIEKIKYVSVPESIAKEVAFANN